ncbi:MAG TPA: VOC family protein [Pyrinomonadaceae bacterium]|nr:VOC family protein [Pyrinomonadaceae bacterium]
MEKYLFLFILWLMVGGLAGPSGQDSRPNKSGPRIYRIILPVPDIAQAAKFYADLFGAEGFRVSAGRHYFDCGGVILALYDPKADGDNTEPRPNLEHVYFAVNDLEGFYKRAERVGGLSKEVGDAELPMGKIAKRPWGERSFYMQDPFGNPLCFVDEKSLFTGPQSSE